MASCRHSFNFAWILRSVRSSFPYRRWTWKDGRCMAYILSMGETCR
jgi:hypothetical protein